MNPQGQQMQLYNYHQSIRPDFANHPWSLTQQFSPGMPISGLCHFVNPGAQMLSNLRQNMTTCSVAEQEDASWLNNGRSLTAPIGCQTTEASMLPGQFYIPTNLGHNSPLAVRVDLMTVKQTATWIRNFSFSRGWDEADQYA